MPWYILRCPVETSGLSILGQNHIHYFGRSQLHDVFNKHKSKLIKLYLNLQIKLYWVIF